MKLFQLSNLRVLTLDQVIVAMFEESGDEEVFQVLAKTPLEELHITLGSYFLSHDAWTALFRIPKLKIFQYTDSNFGIFRQDLIRRQNLMKRIASALKEFVPLQLTTIKIHGLVATRRFIKAVAKIPTLEHLMIYIPNDIRKSTFFKFIDNTDEQGQQCSCSFCDRPTLLY